MGYTLVLLRQEVHSEMDAVKLPPRYQEIARLFGAASESHRMVIREQPLGGEVDANIHTAMEDNTLGFHLRDTPVHMVLFHLEVRDAVTQKAARLRILLINVHVVARTGELLGAS